MPYHCVPVHYLYLNLFVVVGVGVVVRQLLLVALSLCPFSSSSSLLFLNNYFSPPATLRRMKVIALVPNDVRYSVNA
jgi:hypothetical protein